MSSGDYILPKFREELAQNGYVLIPRLVERNLFAEVRVSAVDLIAERGLRQIGNPHWLDLRLNKSEFPLSLLHIYDCLCPIWTEIIGEDSFSEEVQISCHENAGMGTPVHMDGEGLLYRGGFISDLPGFDLLVGIFLDDLIQEDHGNLKVIDGGHATLANYFATNPFGGRRNVTHDEFSVKVKQVKMPALKSLVTRAGDVIIAHGMLPHGVAPNLGKNRYIVYFRVRANSRKCDLTDLWVNMPAMKSAVIR